MSRGLSTPGFYYQHYLHNKIHNLHAASGKAFDLTSQYEASDRVCQLQTAEKEVQSSVSSLLILSTVMVANRIRLWRIESLHSVGRTPIAYTCLASTPSHHADKRKSMHLSCKTSTTIQMRRHGTLSPYLMRTFSTINGLVALRPIHVSLQNYTRSSGTPLTARRL